MTEEQLKNLTNDELINMFAYTMADNNGGEAFDELHRRLALAENVVTHEEAIVGINALPNFPLNTQEKKDILDEIVKNHIELVEKEGMHIGFMLAIRWAVIVDREEISDYLRSHPIQVLQTSNEKPNIEELIQLCADNTSLTALTLIRVYAELKAMKNDEQTK